MIKEFLMVFTIVIIHELGHFIMAKHFKWNFDKIAIYPFGGCTKFNEKINRGGLISASGNEITLKKGHIYNIVISGSLGVSSNASGNTGYYCIQMTDSSEDADFCRKITRIKRDGTSARLPYTHDYHSFNFNRMYDASAKDITLKFLFEQSEYNTLLEEFSGTIIITALD